MCVSKENPSMLKLEAQPVYSGTFSVSDPPAQVAVRCIWRIASSATKRSSREPCLKCLH